MTTLKTTPLIRKISTHNQKYLPLDVILAGRTFRTKIALIIGRTIISTVFGEESTLGQGVATHLTFETLRVEVFVLDTEHLAGTFFLT